MMKTPFPSTTAIVRSNPVRRARRRAHPVDRFPIAWSPSPSEAGPHEISYAVLRGSLTALSEGRHDHGTKHIHYESPRGHGTVRGLLARPREGGGALDHQKRPGVLVVHENRGLNPYIEDVARRLAAEGFVVLAPDGLSSVGGYPGNDDGRKLQRELNREALIEEFLAAAKHLAARPECSGRVGVVGFCFGGMVSNQLAVRWPSLGAAVPFYGRQPAREEVARIQAPLLLHFAENDPRVNAGWPD